jgi:hypothetical protein
LKTWLAAAAVVLVLSTMPAFAQSNAQIAGMFGDEAPYIEAFDTLQAAVAADDAEAVAAMIAYPFRVTADGEEYVFDGPEGVVEHYDSIVTDEIRQAVAEQQYQYLFANQDGIMFGDGQVWLSGICADDTCETVDVRIVTIQTTKE